MNKTSERAAGRQTGVVPGSLTAAWLLWGLPEKLGVAARERRPVVRVETDPRATTRRAA